MMESAASSRPTSGSKATQAGSHLKGYETSKHGWRSPHMATDTLNIPEGADPRISAQPDLPVCTLTFSQYDSNRS